MSRTCFQTGFQSKHPLSVFLFDRNSSGRNPHPMKTKLIVLLLIPLSHFASAGIIFGPVRGQPGESVKLVTHSETPGGTIQRTIGGKSESGTLSITRDRELVWTFRQPMPDGTRRGMVKVPKITTRTVTKINGKEEVVTDASPLNGKMFAMSKSPTGDWSFELDGSVPLTRIQHEIDELTVYLKRDWYPPGRDLNVGDSWEFDPSWVKMIIGRDFKHAQTIGTMRLRQVRHAEKRQIAVLDVTIESTGADFRPDGTESEASVNLKGQVTVNLETMLDEELTLEGTVTTSTTGAGESSKVKLPIRLTARKSFIKDLP